MGKLRIAVKVELLFVLLAIAALNVRIEEIPKLPNNSMRQKIKVFSKGFPKSKLKTKKFKKETIRINNELKSNLEIIMACGETRV